MAQHSQIVGGSTADRVIGCPGSVAAIAALPALAETSSDYADEGTALHQIMSDLVEGVRDMPEIGAEERVALDNGKIIVITDDLIRDALVPAWYWFNNLLTAFGGDENCEVVVEQKVEFPGVKGAFGTCDVIIHSRSYNTSIIIDWKFGAGVPVFATYPGEEADTEYVNRQVMFYACAARATCPELFPRYDMTVIGAICQPRAMVVEAQVSQAEITPDELDSFEKLVGVAVELAKQPNAVRIAGPWCRFAPCRPHCPVHLRPVVDLAALDKAELQQSSVANFGERLAHILDVGEKIEEVLAEARRQAHLLLEGGGVVPGWGLVPKRANRQWVAEEKAIVAALRKRKILRADMYTAPALKSPAQMEKLLPKKSKLPEGLCAAISSGTTLARGEGTVPSLRVAMLALASELKDD